MNAVIKSSESPTIETAVSLVHQRVDERNTAESAHRRSVEALERGRAHLTTVESELTRLTKQQTASNARAAARLARAIGAGRSPASTPTAVPSNEISRAHHKVEVARAAVTRLEATEQKHSDAVIHVCAALGTALNELHEIEAQISITTCMVALDAFKQAFADIMVRAHMTANGSNFGNEINDNNRQHQLLRGIWNALNEFDRMNTDRRQFVSGEPPALTEARESMRQRDAQLTGRAPHPLPEVKHETPPPVAAHMDSKKFSPSPVTAPPRKIGVLGSDHRSNQS